MQHVFSNNALVVNTQFIGINDNRFCIGSNFTFKTDLGMHKMIKNLKKLKLSVFVVVGAAILVDEEMQLLALNAKPDSHWHHY